MTKNKKVPALRFPGFEGEWEAKKLKDVCDKILDGTHFSPKSVEGNRKYITSKNIRNGGLDLNDCNYISDEEHREIFKKCPVKFGDVLLTKDGANTGNCCLNTLNEEFSLLSSVAVLCGKENLLNNNFLLQTLQSHRGFSTMRDVMAGQAITRITLEKINAFRFPFPALPEQQKIAAFLTAIDIRIQQLTRKKALLEQYKKGVMQRVFSREVRFRDEEGKAFPEWEVKRLGEIVIDIKSGKTKPELQGEIPVYGSTGELGKCDNFSHDGAYILIARVGANAGTLNLVMGKFSVTDNTLILEVKPNFDIKYIYFLLLKTNLNKLIFGSGQPLITGGQLKTLKLPFPSLPEQQKIATFLTALDTKINHVTAQITRSQMYKKGLLQQMFV